MMKIFFVEGISGVGKTTAVETLCRELLTVGSGIVGERLSEARKARGQSPPTAERIALEDFT